MRGELRLGLFALASSGCAPAPTPVAPPVVASAPSAESPAPSAPVLVPQPAEPAQPEASAAPTTPEERLARHRNAFRAPRHHPKALEEAARPAKLAPGPYSCRVSREYRLRECSVERDDAGRTLLEFAQGNLLGMRGVVTNSGSALEFEGWLTEEQPFGCSHCADRCIEEPSSCACDELPEAAVMECVAQPLRVTLRPNGAGYRGTMTYRVYYNEYVGEGPARRPEGFVAKEERLVIDLVPGRPPKSKN